ncbi:hypothetical protein DCC81_13035 [Chitinophaga parva]|uniref:Four helix bundle protein n=1 Tax=Chitinophaga parva TaxID=2169414 RepID=A0A2T7BG20_9BACT|nr:four helix bundle protein [Chitinophaga parva]PUZ25226.1 hypothetical protein DCC81_13035 [Chitinophaga parva]
MNKYKNLVVWKNGVDLSLIIYKLTRTFPADERFGLTSQLRRCVVSIPSNIAEGAGRNSNAEFAHFLGIASGSTAELSTQLLIAEKLGYVTTAQFDFCERIITEIQNRLFKLQATLKN